MASTFDEVVKTYLSSMASCVMLQNENPDLFFPACVLMHKLGKYDRNGDARSIALYLHLFLNEAYGQIAENIPQQARELARKWNLKRTSDGSVGYPHPDGTYHWFRK